MDGVIELKHFGQQNVIASTPTQQVNKTHIFYDINALIVLSIDKDSEMSVEVGLSIWNRGFTGMFSQLKFGVSKSAFVRIRS